MKNKNNDLINNLKAEISKEIKRKVSKQHEKLDFFKNKILQQASELRKRNPNNQVINEKLKNNKTNEDILGYVKNLFELAEANIPDVVVDSVHI